MPNQSLDIDEIIHQYFARIHRAALVLSGNPWDADDLAQERVRGCWGQPQRHLPWGQERRLLAGGLALGRAGQGPRC